MTTIKEWEAEEQYMEFLNDMEGCIKIDGMEYPAGNVLRMIDRVAFREGMLNYFDSLDIEVN